MASTFFFVRPNSPPTKCRATCFLLFNYHECMFRFLVNVRSTSDNTGVIDILIPSHRMEVMGESRGTGCNKYRTIAEGKCHVNISWGEVKFSLKVHREFFNFNSIEENLLQKNVRLHAAHTSLWSTRKFLTFFIEFIISFIENYFFPSTMMMW